MGIVIIVMMLILHIVIGIQMEVIIHTTIVDHGQDVLLLGGTIIGLLLGEIAHGDQTQIGTQDTQMVVHIHTDVETIGIMDIYKTHIIQYILKDHIIHTVMDIHMDME